MHKFGKFCAAVLVALSACGAQAYDVQQFADTALSFKLGVEHNYPPYQFRDDHNQLAGFEIDLMDEIAQEMGVTFTYEEGVFDHIYARTQGGDLDGLLGGNCITADRKRAFLLSDTYLHSGQCVAVSEYYGAQAFQDVDSMKNRSICVESETMGHRYTRTLHFSNVKIFDTIPDIIDNFNEGECVLMIADCMIFDFYIKTGYIKNAEVINDPIISTQIVMLVNPKSPQLLDIVNEGLAKVKANGRYEEIYRKWFYNRTVGRPLHPEFNVEDD